MSFLLADIKAECPALMFAFLSLILPQAMCVRTCVYIQQERTVGHVCASSWVCVRLFDWLTLLTSLIWTIKSVAVLRHEGYDGWSFTSQHLSLPLTPHPRSPDLYPQKKPRNALFITSYLFYPAAWCWGRTVRGSVEEAGCEGVNPEREGGVEWVEVILLSWVC